MEAVGAGWRIYGIGPVYQVDAKARACLCAVPPTLVLSFSFRCHSLRPYPLPHRSHRDASRTADQRDFCLKHDLSLKYLKPDYLWVCHLGWRDVIPAGQWQDPPLHFFFLFAPRAMRLRRWNPTPLNSLYETLSHLFFLPLFLYFTSVLLSFIYFFINEEFSTTSFSDAMKFDTNPL